MQRIGNGRQFAEKGLKKRAGSYSEGLRELAVQGPDAGKDRRMPTGHRGRQQRFEAIGDTGQRGMDDDWPRARRQPIPQYGNDVVPVTGARNAGTTKFQDDPGWMIVWHWT
jgi:hypothetical protein